MGISTRWRIFPADLNPIAFEPEQRRHLAPLRFFQNGLERGGDFVDVVLAKVFGEQVVREVREEGVVKVLKVDRPSGGFGKGLNMAEAIPVDGDRTSAVLRVGRPFLNKFFKKFPEGHPGVFHLPDDLALRLIQFQFEFLYAKVLPLTFVG